MTDDASIFETEAEPMPPAGADVAAPRKRGRPRKAEAGEAESHAPDTSGSHTPPRPPMPDQFADPLVATITETWRSRQDFVRAQQRLTLQAKSILRRLTAGDKEEASKLYDLVVAEKFDADPRVETAALAIMPLVVAQRPLIEERSKLEKRLEKLGRDLPIAHVVDQIKGINHKTLATIVGELGDLSMYVKGVPGVWKRAGLAVINGERQRRVAGEAALEHGYSPSRRSVFWNIAASLIKAQGLGDDAGKYRRAYDVHKEKQAAKPDVTKVVAHNRALRFMTKTLLRDLTREWVRVANAGEGRHSRVEQDQSCAALSRPAGASAPADLPVAAE